MMFFKIYTPQGRKLTESIHLAIFISVNKIIRNRRKSATYYIIFYFSTQSISTWLK